ncbi:MAG: GH3 auxin-responsive promoter family protein [Ignavibacteria bacterium]|nr:GH3 auxin-responsive promoter family protein [Ignavibacteria bacterium]
MSLEMVATISILASIVILQYSESKMPFNPEWKPLWKDWKNDGLYLFIVQTVLPKILMWFLILFCIRFFGSMNPLNLNIWPSHLPLFVQAILVTFGSDLLRYWLHRLSHTIPFLWRFHAVHHSVEKLYWMNTSRFHPVEKAMQFLFDVVPFFLLGTPPEALALHLVWYGVNGFFQHSNIDLKYGWLNYIVSSTELHRWHHARDAKVSNNNYGNNIILWDLLFGSYFNPQNRTVSAIGLINRNYPKEFVSQMTAPLIRDLDKKDVIQFILENACINFIMKINVSLLNVTFFRKFRKHTLHCEQIQRDVLKQIVKRNACTEFGVKHNFQNAITYEDFRENIPITDYEYLRTYIEQQAANKGSKELTNDAILMFNQTSGSTAQPKYIPVTKQTMKTLKISQKINLCVQYKNVPNGFKGKILGIVSPAIESMSADQIPIGSASGLFYKNMPGLVKRKYVVPHSVFEIKDYHAKYYVILLLALQHKDITYIGTANPTTLLKLFEILNNNKTDLLSDLKNKTISVSEMLSEKIQEQIKNELKPTSKRIAELETIFSSTSSVSFAGIWPFVSLVTTWTGGSCGVSLNSVLQLLPTNTVVMDPGYLASEIRGSITINPKNQGGIFTFQSNFFEFVERNDWENGIQNFILLHKLKVSTEYYVFVTTPSGLYRYNMNDIILVKGYYNTCPIISFIQKGNGICNITGEKLYEGQILQALDQMKLNLYYVQVLANEESALYECYLELADVSTPSDKYIADELDNLISLQNIEYSEKRKSNRLKQIEVRFLQKGTYDNIKKMSIAKGQNESQFKMVSLQYKNKFPFNLSQFIK